MEDVYEQWRQFEPREALQFYAAQEQVDPFHRTGVTLAKPVAKGDPEGAIEWVRSMKNAAHETMVRTALNVLPTESES